MANYQRLVIWLATANTPASTKPPVQRLSTAHGQNHAQACVSIVCHAPPHRTARIGDSRWLFPRGWWLFWNAGARSARHRPAQPTPPVHFSPDRLPSRQCCDSSATGCRQQRGEIGASATRQGRKNGAGGTRQGRRWQEGEGISGRAKRLSLEPSSFPGPSRSLGIRSPFPWREAQPGGLIVLDGGKSGASGIREASFLAPALLRPRSRTDHAFRLVYRGMLKSTLSPESCDWQRTCVA